MSLDFITQNLDRLNGRIVACCERYGRDPSEVALLAVSKTKPASLIQAAIAAGQHDFGENYLQEAQNKITSIEADIEWHYIGAIQSNKTRAIAEHFDWVHTVASEKVARRLSEQRPMGRAPLKIMLQVNINDEGSKSGVAPEALQPLLESVHGLTGIEVVGLMAIPRVETEFSRQRANFSMLRSLLEQARNKFGERMPGFKELSMGMSGDMEAAIAEGATWLRVGTAIFGERTNVKQGPLL